MTPSGGPSSPPAPPAGAAALSRARERVAGGARDRRLARAEHVAGGVDRLLQRVLRAGRGVDPHGRVGQRAQLRDVLVLDARHLLHLVVAAVGDLEGGERLAQERRRGLEHDAAGGGVVEVAHAPPRRAWWWASASSITLSWEATASRPSA